MTIGIEIWKMVTVLQVERDRSWMMDRQQGHIIRRGHHPFPPHVKVGVPREPPLPATPTQSFEYIPPAPEMFETFQKVQL